MRSAREIAFRIHQEASNLRMWTSPPVLPSASGFAPAAGFPAGAAVADKLRGSEYAKQVIALAEEVLAHHFRLLGIELNLGAEIAWRADPVHQKSTGLAYFRRIPYLDFDRAGDHKIIWELNRHQHLVLLAQAFLFSGREEFLREAERQLATWWEQNPFARGINWSSALEAAFRAMSWMWLDHLAGNALRVRGKLLESIYQHGCYLEANLSVYFSPNTHLLGEAVALEALGTAYPWFPQAHRWKQTGARIMNQELSRQVRADGSHFEQSSYYHVYTLDFFLLHKILGGMDGTPDESLRHMAAYLDALMGPARRLPLLGDDDGGRLFGLPFGFRHTGRATLATAAILLGLEIPFDQEDVEEQAIWWLGADVMERSRGAGKDRTSRFFADAGVAVMEAGGVQAIIDGGPFGTGTGGHSHSDTLSAILRQGDQDLLIDPGTYTYISDPQWRDRFRGSAAHNTVRIDGRNQAAPVNAFRWADPPDAEVAAWETSAEWDYFDAACRFAGFQHRRRVVFLKQPLLLLILDQVHGPPGEPHTEHEVEQFWHFAASPQPIGEGRYWICTQRRNWMALATSGEAQITQGGEFGWRSAALGMKTPAEVLRVHRKCKLPVRWAAGFGLNGGEPMGLEFLAAQDDAVDCLRLGNVRVRFTERRPEVFIS